MHKSFSSIRKLNKLITAITIEFSKRHNLKYVKKSYGPCPLHIIIWSLFHANTLSCFKGISHTQFCHINCYLQSSKGQTPIYIYIQELWFLCSSGNPEVSWRYLELFYSYKLDKILLSKLLLTKLTRASRFLQSARCPMLVNIYMKIYENILNIKYLNVKDRTRSCHKKTATKHKQELWLLHYASRLIVLNISTNFHENILNCFNVIERTGSCYKDFYIQGSKGRNQKYITKSYCSCALLVLLSLIFVWNVMKIP